MKAPVPSKAADGGLVDTVIENKQKVDDMSQTHDSNVTTVIQELEVRRAKLLLEVKEIDMALKVVHRTCASSL